MIAESERMLTENNMDETFLNASITFEVWYFGLGEPTGFMKFFVDHTEPNDRHFSGGNEVWFDRFEGVRVPKGSYQKQSNNRNSTTNDGNQDQEENDTATASVATLENVRNAVLSVCGMDFRIEDDVLVASSGILTTIRNILLEDDDGTMSSTCLALLRLIVSRFMPPSSSTQQMGGDIGSTTVVHAQNVKLNTAVQPHIVTILRELISQRLPVPTLSTKLIAPRTFNNNSSNTNNSNSSKTFIFHDPIPILNTRAEFNSSTLCEGIFTKLTNHHTISLQLYVPDVPTSNTPEDDDSSLWLDIYRKGTKKQKPSVSYGENNKKLPCEFFCLQYNLASASFRVVFGTGDENAPTEIVATTKSKVVIPNQWNNVVVVLEKCDVRIYVDSSRSKDEKEEQEEQVEKNKKDNKKDDKKDDKKNDQNNSLLCVAKGTVKSDVLRSYLRQ